MVRTHKGFAEWASQEMGVSEAVLRTLDLTYEQGRAAQGLSLEVNIPALCIFQSLRLPFGGGG